MIWAALVFILIPLANVKAAESYIGHRNWNTVVDPTHRLPRPLPKPIEIGSVKQVEEKITRVSSIPAVRKESQSYLRPSINLPLRPSPDIRLSTNMPQHSVPSRNEIPPNRFILPRPHPKPEQVGPLRGTQPSPTSKPLPQPLPTVAVVLDKQSENVERKKESPARKLVNEPTPPPIEIATAGEPLILAPYEPVSPPRYVSPMPEKPVTLITPKPRSFLVPRPRPVPMLVSKPVPPRVEPKTSPAPVEAKNIQPSISRDPAPRVRDPKAYETPRYRWSTMLPNSRSSQPQPIPVYKVVPNTKTDAFTNKPDIAERPEIYVEPDHVPEKPEVFVKPHPATDPASIPEPQPKPIHLESENLVKPEPEFLPSEPEAVPVLIEPESEPMSNRPNDPDQPEPHVTLPIQYQWPDNRHRDKITPLPKPVIPPTTTTKQPPLIPIHPKPPRPTPYIPEPKYTTSAPSQLLDYQCRDSNGYYGIEVDCDSYVECRKYTAVMYTCPDGLHFNSNAIWPAYPCAYSSEVECDNNAVIREPQSTSDCPRQYGFFPLPDNECSKYIMCQEGQANIMSCPAGLVFNVAVSSCDWPANVPSCNPDVFKGFTCPAPPLEDDEYAADMIYKYRFGESCIEYIACQRGRPRLLKCDPGLSFDEESQVCIDSDYVTNCKA